MLSPLYAYFQVIHKQLSQILRNQESASTENSESQMMSNSFRNMCSILYQGAVTHGQFSAQRRDCRGWTGDFFAVLVCMLQNAAGAVGEGWAGWGDRGHA